MVLCLLACAAVWLIGCGSRKATLVGPEQAAPYPPLTTPENTLTAMIRAYAARDTVELALVYDDAYSGLSYDPNDFSEWYTFSKTNEVRHVAALIGSST